MVFRRSWLSGLSGLSVFALASILTLPLEAAAQGQAPTASWTWDADVRAFFGLNYQHRKFRDFLKWESQNWLMGEGVRKVGRGRLRLSSMLSLEAFTLQALGSPQVFQTGETYRRQPLVDYQHPHELVMGLGGAYTIPVGGWTVVTAASLVGEPSLGPPSFMHRPSASENPAVPLSHHSVDSTHSTPGVLRAGVERGGAKMEASWFRGREPDENRTDLDLGALDSWAMRLSWTRGPWSIQGSGAHLTDPDILTPGYDNTRMTASVGYTKERADGSLATLAAFGWNREAHGILRASLLEGTLRWRRLNAAYLRAELVKKDILDAGLYHPNFVHVHRFSQVGALTLGYMLEVPQSLRHWLGPALRGPGRIGIGGDVTTYSVPPNLRPDYGRPLSFHAFLRYGFTASSGPEPAEHHH